MAAFMPPDRRGGLPEQRRAHLTKGMLRTSAPMREVRPLSIADGKHVPDAGGDPPDVTVLSPVWPRQTGAQTVGGAATDRGWFGGTGAEHHGRFDESSRAVHNNAACLLLLHKATTVPASSLLGPQRCWGSSFFLERLCSPGEHDNG